MATLVLLEAKAKSASAVEELKELLKKRLPETRAYDGCQSITCFLGDDARTFVFVEHWDSAQHYEKYLAWRTETGVLKQLTDRIEGEPSIRYFEALDA